MLLTTGRDVQVSVLAASDVVWVNCDAYGLENVILNLVANARDAMPHGGRLTAETALSDPLADVLQHRLVPCEERSYQGEGHGLWDVACHPCGRV